MKTLLTTGPYMYELYGHEDGKPHGYVGIPPKVRVLDEDWFFTGRIKYHQGKTTDGITTKVRVYFEIKYTESKLVKEKIWGSNEYANIDRVLWVSSDMFDFDFSDEYTEEIYECV